MLVLYYSVMLIHCHHCHLLLALNVLPTHEPVEKEEINMLKLHHVQSRTQIRGTAYSSLSIWCLPEGQSFPVSKEAANHTCITFFPT